MIGFNGTGLMLPPTTAGWVSQDTLGISGEGKGIYGSLREFQMTFNLTTQNEFYELLYYFGTMATGTIVATLPAWNSNVFYYREYSGVVIRQPEMSEYFAEEYFSSVKLTLLVRT